MRRGTTAITRPDQSKFDVVVDVVVLEVPLQPPYDGV
jgi:hypothetical protein